MLGIEYMDNREAHADLWTGFGTSDERNVWGLYRDSAFIRLFFVRRSLQQEFADACAADPDSEAAIARARERYTRTTKSDSNMQIYTHYNEHKHQDVRKALCREGTRAVQIQLER